LPSPDIHSTQHRQQLINFSDGGPLREFLLFAMRVEEEVVLVVEAEEFLERAVNHKQLLMVYLAGRLPRN